MEHGGLPSPLWRWRAASLTLAVPLLSLHAPRPCHPPSSLLAPSPGWRFPDSPCQANVHE